MEKEKQDKKDLAIFIAAMSSVGFLGMPIVVR